MWTLRVGACLCVRVNTSDERTASEPTGVTTLEEVRKELGGMGALSLHFKMACGGGACDADREQSESARDVPQERAWQNTPSDSLPVRSMTRIGSLIFF